MSMNHVDEVRTLSEDAIRKLAVLIDENTRHSEGCWEWTGSKNSEGRAQLYIGRTHPVARVVFVLHVGPVGDKYVCHSCDNVSCVNPDHLFLGTHSQNMRDMTAKNRRHDVMARLGKDNVAAKLTTLQVEAIREDKKRGMRCSDIAVKYAISRQHVWNIVAGKYRKSG